MSFKIKAGKSLGKKKKGQYEYRLRWDEVVYQPGTLQVVAYRNGASGPSADDARALEELMRPAPEAQPPASAGESR